MGLVIDDKDGILRFAGTPNQEDRDNAVKLYNKWKTAIPKIESDLIAEGLLSKNPNTNRTGNNETWWELGSRLGKLIDDNDLIKSSDWFRIWEALRLHASDRITKADRGPNRDHFRNCYRYSKLPKEKVVKVVWRAWSEWLDRKVLQANGRGDKWLNQNIDKITRLKSDDFRKMTKFYYREVTKKGKIELEVFSDEKFYKLWDEKLDEFLADLNKEK